MGNAGRIAALIVALAAATSAFGQSMNPRDQLAPTVHGGTGLFDTRSTRTVDKGEVGVGLFWNNFDREPGDVDITQIPVNVTLGLTNRWEVWANLNAWQQTTGDRLFEDFVSSPPMCTGVTAERGEIYVGESVALMANASDPDGDVLTYTWTATGGRIVGSGSSVTFDATGLAEGSYTVTVQTNDGYNHTVECSTTVNVRQRPNVCPTVSVVADKTSVMVGETVTFTATASDPDNGPRPLAYEWTSSAGSLGRVLDNEVQLDTTGLTDTITVTVTVKDGDPNCRDTKSVEFSIQPPPGEGLGFLKIEDLYFPRDGARIDNAMKRILDDLAIRLQMDPTLRLVVDGHSETGERPGIALRRAENARQYLVTEKGIDPARIIVRSFDDRCSKGDPRQDRRVELYPLPQGRTPDEIEKGCA